MATLPAGPHLNEYLYMVTPKSPLSWPKLRLLTPPLSASEKMPEEAAREQAADAEAPRCNRQEVGL